MNLALDNQGNLLKSPADVAATWYTFLANKFAATAAEKTREPLEQLPTIRRPEDMLSREEFNKALKKMSDGKAVGPEGVPAEAYKYCPRLREDLFQLINQIW